MNHHRRGTVSAVIGLMLGSLFSVIMGATTLSQPLPPLAAASLDMRLFLTGVLAVAVFVCTKILALRRKFRR